MINRRGKFRLRVKRPFVCRLRVLRLVPSLGRKALRQRQKFPPFSIHCPTDPQTTSRLLVFTIDHRNCRQGNFVACEVRHFVQATTPNFTDHYTVFGLDDGP